MSHIYMKILFPVSTHQYSVYILYRYKHFSRHVFSGTHSQIWCEVDIAVGWFLVYSCTTVGSICPYNMRVACNAVAIFVQWYMPIMSSVLRELCIPGNLLTLFYMTGEDENQFYIKEYRVIASEWKCFVRVLLLTYMYTN